MFCLVAQIVFYLVAQMVFSLVAQMVICRPFVIEPGDLGSPDGRPLRLFSMPASFLISAATL